MCCVPASHFIFLNEVNSDQLNVVKVSVDILYKFYTNCSILQDETNQKTNINVQLFYLTFHKTLLYQKTQANLYINKGTEQKIEERPNVKLKRYKASQLCYMVK